MKKLLLIILLNSLISCRPFLKSNDNIRLTYTKAIEESEITTAFLQETDTQYTSSAVIFEPSATSTLVVMTAQHPVSIPTILPFSTDITVPDIMATQPVFRIIQREFNPSEWKLLYDKDMVWQIGLSSKDQIWIRLDQGQVGYFDGNNWVLFSEKDDNIPDILTDMAVAPDGTIWISGRQVISHFKEGLWKIFYIPDAPEGSDPRLAIDVNNLVWLSLWGYQYGGGVRTFDGINWGKQSLWSFGMAEQLFFTSNGTLWASTNGTIGRYNEKIYKEYSRNDFWPKASGFGGRFASDSQGNIFGIYNQQEWIIKIYRNGNISKVPFDLAHYEFNPRLMRLFIDKQNRIWTNACLEKGDCLVFFQDNQWISFKNLPFHIMTDMKELSDGTLLVATNKGLFQYKPEN